MRGSATFFIPVAVTMKLTLQCHLYDYFLHLRFLYTHYQVSVLDGELTEESAQFRFLHSDCLANLKVSFGLILCKDSDMRVSIPLDLSTSPFIPRFIRSRPSPLLTPSLVLFLQRSS